MPSLLAAAPERAVGIAQAQDGPAGLRRPAGPSASEGRGKAELRNAKRMRRFGSGEVRRLDFLLRGPEGSTAKPSQPLDSTPAGRKVQGWRQARGVAWASAGNRGSARRAVAAPPDTANAQRCDRHREPAFISVPPESTGCTDTQGANDRDHLPDGPLLGEGRATTSPIWSRCTRNSIATAPIVVLGAVEPTVRTDWLGERTS
jgi:hypothetical protein